MLPKIFLNSLLLLGFTLAGLFTIELGLRYFTGKTYLDVDLRLRNGELVYEPNQVQRWKRIEWDVTYKINSKGFRDFEYPQPSRNALVILGDSFTEGYGVEQFSAFPKELERLLKPEQPPYRVYNAGLQGRLLRSYLRIYDQFFKNEKGLQLVLMGFCIAMDIESESRIQSRTVTVVKKSSLLYPIKRYLCEHSVLYNFIRRPARLSQTATHWLSAMGIMGAGPGGDFLAYDEKFLPAWKHTAEIIDDFNVQLRKEGREFVLLLIPSHDQVYDVHFKQLKKYSGQKFDPFVFNEFMAVFCRQRGIKLLDLAPALKQAALKQPDINLYFKTDGHWTAQGHAVVAAAIHRYLKANALLRPRLN
ncbi:MAG: hypothetical protein A3J74_11380 [Elusimicrobia bacterium RIFCSPHIGHO2_02_FULL_57_9]|nr:MAG: hypothetical protein A3J74_11380 [Elusimicrobia bacterium RIFCSPHIGHO2_02_FULL_57_9]